MSLLTKQSMKLLQSKVKNNTNSTFQAGFGVEKESVPRPEGSPCPSLLAGVALSKDARVRSEESELPLPRGAG